MNAIEQLKSVLCDQEGKCCIRGSDADRAIVDRALEELTTPQQAEAVPPGYVLVPIDVLQAASESLGNFVSDHGWTDADMQAMDNLDAILAQQKGGV